MGTREGKPVALPLLINWPAEYKEEPLIRLCLASSRGASTKSSSLGVRDMTQQRKLIEEVSISPVSRVQAQRHDADLFGFLGLPRLGNRVVSTRIWRVASR